MDSWKGFGESNWESITFGAGLFFAVSSAGKVASSSDSLSWNFGDIGSGYHMAAVGSNNKITVLKRGEETKTALIVEPKEPQSKSLAECIGEINSKL